MRKLLIIAILGLTLTGCATTQPVPVLVNGEPTGEMYTPPPCSTAADRALAFFLIILSEGNAPQGGNTLGNLPPCK